MPWLTPSADAISKSLRSAIKAELPDAQPTLWPNNLYVVTKVVAQGFRALYMRLGWLLRQAFVSTAEAEFLERHGADLGIARLAATFAAGEAVAETSAGASIPNARRLLRGDGVVFITVGDVTTTAPTTTLAVRALETGRAGNTLPETALVLETGIAGVGDIEVGEAGLFGGADLENDASLRQRILVRKQNPPHGGSPAEYVGWARLHPGVTRVFIQRATPEPGSVTVVFMMDAAYDDGIPLAGDEAALRTHLLAYSPAADRLVVSGPIPIAINVELVLAVDTPAIRSAVQAELRAQFRRRAEPGSADAVFTFHRSWISEAISMATGEVAHTLVEPSTDVDCGVDTDGIPEIAVLGTVTFS